MTTPTPTDLPEALRLIEGIQWYTTRRKAVPLQYAERACDHLRRLHAALSAAAPAVAPSVVAWELEHSALGPELTAHKVRAEEAERLGIKVHALCRIAAPTTEQSSEVAQAGAPADMEDEQCRCEPSEWVPPRGYDGDGSVAAMARRATQPQAGAESYPPMPSTWEDDLDEAISLLGMARLDKLRDEEASHSRKQLQAVLAALRARGAVPSDARTDALYDSAYIAGAKAGYNFGVDEDAAGLGRIIEARSGYLAVLAAPAAPMSAQAPSDAEIGELWKHCDMPTEENGHTTGPLPFARAVLARWAAAPQPPAALPGEQDAAHWPQLRSALAMFLLGWAGRHPDEQTMEAACTSLDSVTEPGSPLAVLRSAPDWRDHMAAKGRTDGGAA